MTVQGDNVEDTVDFAALLQEGVDALEQAAADEASDEDAGLDDESGELTDEDDLADESDESQALGDDEDDGDDEDEEDDELDELDDDLEDDDDDSQVEADPKPATELDKLRAEMETVKAESKAREQQLLELIAGRKEAPKQQQESPEDRQFAAAWEAAWTDPDKLKEFPPEVVSQVKRASAHFQKDQARYALNPRAEFVEKFGPVLQEILSHELAPLRDFVKSKRNEQVTAPYQEEIANPETREKLLDILQEIDGAENADPAFQQRRIGLAVRIFKAEEQATSNAGREQELRAEKRQAKARKRTRRGSRGSKSRKAQGPAPELENPEDILDYANMLLAKRPDLLEG